MFGDNGMRQDYGKTKLLLIVSLAGLLTAAACLFLYYFDNKYTASGPQAKNGVLRLTEQDLATHPVLFLVDGWEYFGGKLLSPGDFTAGSPQPNACVFIGQYGGFEAGNPAGSPHGQASYRMRITLPQEAETYMLELPEIFSAYRAYVNGEPAAAMENPEQPSYSPETKNRTIAVKASERLEILLAVSDYSHIYSGMVYPPAFGQPEALSDLLNARLAFRTALCAFSLVIGFLSLLVGFAGKKYTAALLYGLLCLFFMGFAGYPIWKTFSAHFYPFYAIENISFCAMLTTVLMIQRMLYPVKYHRPLIFFGWAMCFLSAVLPFAAASGNLLVCWGYSALVMLLEWGIAGMVTAAAGMALLRNAVSSAPLLCGVVCFDVGLFMDRLLPLYEPIITGWFTELTAFLLVLCIGVSIGRELAQKYRDSFILEERAASLAQLTEMQQASYDLLLENIEETRAVKHDMRHHLLMIEEYAKGRDYEGLLAYLGAHPALRTSSAPLSYSQNEAVNAIVHHYAQRAKAQGFLLKYNLNVERNVAVSPSDLCGILCNLLENGMEACERQKDGNLFLSLSMGQSADMLAIRMENSTDRNITEKNGVFFSSKAPERKGYGLDSIKTIARRYQGEAEFVYDSISGKFFCTVLLFLQNPHVTP